MADRAQTILIACGPLGGRAGRLLARLPADVCRVPLRCPLDGDMAVRRRGLDWRDVRAQAPCGCRIPSWSRALRLVEDFAAASRAGCRGYCLRVDAFKNRPAVVPSRNAGYHGR